MDDVLLNKYAIVQRCLKRVAEEYKGHEEELAVNYTCQDSIILNIQRACQAAQDMANRVIRIRQLGIPQNSRDSFSLLAEDQLISVKLSKSLINMVGFRNIAVHEYQPLNMDILKAVIEKHLQDIETVARELLRMTD